MATMAEHEALSKAINSGVRKVVYSDRTVEYQSTSDMLAALAKIEAELGVGAGSEPRYSRASFSRE